MHVKTFQLSSRIQQSAFSWFKSMLLVCSFLIITYKSIYSLTILEQFKKYLNVVLKIITKDFLNDALKTPYFNKFEAVKDTLKQTKRLILS